jgi:hypothetical protein
MRIFILILTAIFIASSLLLVGIVLYLPPILGGTLVLTNLTYFFLSLFASLAAFFSLVLYSASLIFESGGRSTTTTSVQRSKFLLRQSLRRSVILTILVVLILLLRLLGLGNLFNIILILAGGLLTEMYLSNR